MLDSDNVHSLVTMTVFAKDRENAKDYANVMGLENAEGLKYAKGKVLVTRETAPAKGKLNTMRNAGKYVSAIAQAMNMVPAKALAHVRVTAVAMGLVNVKGSVFV